MNPLPLVGKYFEQERERWLLWAPAGMGAGVACYFGLADEPALWCLAAAPLLALLAWLMRGRDGVFITLCALFCFALGFDAAQAETRLLEAPIMDRESHVVPLSGRLMLTEVMPDGVRLTLKDVAVERWKPETTPRRVRIRLDRKTLADIPPPGSRIGLWAQIGPFSEPVEPGATDFRWQAYFRQLGGLGWSYSHIDLIDANPPSTSWRDGFSLAFERARLRLAQHVYARLSGDVAAMTAARLNGEQTAISEPVIQAMRIAGLAHLLSTSGFHVTIMGLLVYFPLRAFFALIPWIALRFPIKKWAAGGAIASAAGYTFLVGSQAATMRSLLMTALVMFAIVADRRAAAMHVVMLSAALAMLISPDATLGPSFQMSFAAVMCLIAARERHVFDLEPGAHTPALPGWLGVAMRYILAIITTSLIATAATTPFAIYHFQSFSLYGFAANTLAIPLTSFWVMPCILLAYITAPFGLDGIFISGAGAGMDLTIRIAETVSSWPYSIFYLPAMPAAALGAIVLGGLWLCLWREKWRWLGVVPIILGALYPLYTAQPDVMIAPDGKAWAAKLDDGRLVVSDIGRDAFIIQQWQERLGNIPVVDADDLPPDEKQLRCDDMGCVYRNGAHSVALPVLAAAALEDCMRADIVIAPFVIKDCAAKTVIDEPEFWHHGAHVITFDGNTARVDYVREGRGLRPWQPGYGWQKPKNENEDE